jgi:hypothetical protein
MYTCINSHLFLYVYVGSFGSTPYFIKRKEGNIMIDIPRFNTKLANTIELEGGVQKIIVTHSGII